MYLSIRVRALKVEMSQNPKERSNNVTLAPVTCDNSDHLGMSRSSDKLFGTTNIRDSDEREDTGCDANRDFNLAGVARKTQ
jgi:hypothetical protein